MVGLARAYAAAIRGRALPGKAATPRYHEEFSKSFLLTHAELTIRVVDEIRTFGEGDFVYVRRRGVHSFRNDADAV